MKYLNSKKDIKYHIKSSLVTFSSVFLPIFATLATTVDVSGISSEQVTGTFVLSILVTFLRLAVIALLLTTQKLLSKFKK